MNRIYRLIWSRVMNNPAASRGVSNTQSEAPFVASHGELNPKRLRDVEIRN